MAESIAGIINEASPQARRRFLEFWIYVTDLQSQGRRFTPDAVRFLSEAAAEINRRILAGENPLHKKQEKRGREQPGNEERVNASAAFLYFGSYNKAGLAARIDRATVKRHHQTVERDSDLKARRDTTLMLLKGLRVSVLAFDKFTAEKIHEAPVDIADLLPLGRELETLWRKFNDPTYDPDPTPPK